ncbi:MAG: helix-turn-helix domain-containing protein [Rikenellaceae bacterium]
MVAQLKKIFLTTIFSCMLFGICAAHEYVRITMSDGLQSNYVTTIHRDTTGFVWIGTADGVSRFDGVRVKQYELLDQNATPSIVRINRLVADPQLGLLLASSKGLYIFDATRDRFVLDESCQSPLFCVTKVSDYILMGSDNGLIVKSLNSGDLMTFLEGEKIVAIHSSDQCTYLLTDSRLYWLRVCDQSAAQAAFELRMLHNSDGANFSDMVISQGFIYIGTDRRGVYEYDTKRDILHDLENCEAKIIRSLSLTGHTLYIATDGQGVWQYDLNDRQVVKHITKNNIGLNSNAITCIDADNKGLLWLGSYSTGVYFSQPEDTFISLVPSTADISARCIYRVASNRFIIGTRDGLVLWRDGQIYKHFHSDNYEPIRSNIVISILPYRDYLYIVGTYGGGVFLLDEQLGEVYPFDIDADLAKKLTDKSVYKVEVINQDLYFFTLDGLIRYSATGGVELWNSENSVMPSSLIYACCYDSERNLFWIGTSKGLCRFDIKNDNIDHVELKDTPNDFRSNVIVLDKDNNLLLDRNYIELLKIDSDSFDVERIDFATSSLDHISGVIEDNNRRDLWIATTNGLYCYNQEDSQSIKFTQSSGLRSANICPNATLKLSDNRFFVGTEAGMYTLQSQPALNREQSRSIYLSSFKVNGYESLEQVLARSLRNRSGQIEYVLKSDVRDMLEINVVDPAFRRTDQNKYAFSLDGEKWHYPSSNNYVIGSSLKVGRYPIYVKVVGDVDTSWGEAIFIGYLIVGLSTATMIWITVVVALLLLYLIFWRTIRKLILLNKRKSNSKQLSIQDKRSAEILEIIKQTLEQDKGYRNPVFRLKDLATATSLSTAEISHVLNNYLHLSFTDFINDYRIEEIKKLLLEEDANYYMLHVLAERCGFNSKTSFYRIFKNKTGVTPLQYRRQEVGDSAKKIEKE